MTWDDHPAMPEPLTPMQPAVEPDPAATARLPTTGAATRQTFGFKRTILTAAVAGLLLVGGAAAVVNAASPDPSASPGVTAPSNGGTTSPSTTPNHGKANCPNMGTDGSGSSGGTVLPSPAATPQT